MRVRTGRNTKGKKMRYQIIFTDGDFLTARHTLGEAKTIKDARDIVQEHVSKHKNGHHLLAAEIEPDNSGADIMYQIGRSIMRHYIINQLSN